MAIIDLDFRSAVATEDAVLLRSVGSGVLRAWLRILFGVKARRKPLNEFFRFEQADIRPTISSSTARRR